MIISKQKKKENIAEYLLYMWQLEDIIRAFNFDISKIKEAMVDPHDQPEEVKSEMVSWYDNLIEMMKLEQLHVSGHLQINKNIIIALTDLHLRLQKEQKEIAYQTVFNQTLPEISLFRTKHNDPDSSDIEICFKILYGSLILKLKGEKLHAETLDALKKVSKCIAVLASKYKQVEEGDLELE